jgi:RNA polymerase sigma factor (TIGR02999 family)
MLRRPERRGSDHGRGCEASDPPMNDITRILSAVDQGDPQAAEQLLPLVYEELRTLAARRLAEEKPGQTLQATALVHEAYVRLVGSGQSQEWNGRGHFFAAAGAAMRCILVDAARRKRSGKHGGGRERVELLADAVAAPVPDVDLVALDAALTRLAGVDPLKARLVELRYFAGLTGEQAAAALGLSPSAVDRLWVFTRAWLRRELGYGASV